MSTTIPAEATTVAPAPATPPLGAGIHAIGEAAYHADPCAAPSLSNSLIKVLIARSPRHAWMHHPRLNPQFETTDSAAFDFGKAAHALLLEGRDICAVVDAPDWRTKAAQAAREQARADGKAPLLAREHARLGAMVAAARGYLGATGLAHVIERGRAEQTMVWLDADGDGCAVWCRARLDLLADDRSLILDYKTTNVVSPDKFTRAMMELGYDTQSVFYTRGLYRLGFERTQFMFLVQETEAPYCCYLVELAESMRQLAAIKVERAVNLFGMCLQADRWPAYSTDVYAAEAPAWALHEAGLAGIEQ